MSNIKDIIEVTLPTWAICPLAYGDVDGLEDDDINALDKFENDLIKHHGVGSWSFPDDIISCAYHTSSNDVTSLSDYCVRAEYITFNGSK